jgi:hypothetical protein
MGDVCPALPDTCARMHEPEFRDRFIQLQKDLAEGWYYAEAMHAGGLAPTMGTSFQSDVPTSEIVAQTGTTEPMAIEEQAIIRGGTGVQIQDVTLSAKRQDVVIQPKKSCCG